MKLVPVGNVAECQAELVESSYDTLIITFLFPQYFFLDKKVFKKSRLIQLP